MAPPVTHHGARTPSLLYEIALGYASSAAIVGRVPTKLDARQLAAQREELVAGCVATLREAVAEGFKDLDKVRNEPAFDAIRPWPEFQAIVLDLAFPSEPFATPIAVANE